MNADPYTPEERRFIALQEIVNERARQDERWGPQQFERIGPWETLAVLTEELGEIARVLNDHGAVRTVGADGLGELRTELTQLAACCLAWLEALP
jgi:NTP pyrophosphatase (non-canonical NTP hydrolase)